MVTKQDATQQTLFLMLESCPYGSAPHNGTWWWLVKEERWIYCEESDCPQELAVGGGFRIHWTDLPQLAAKANEIEWRVR